MVPGRWTVAAVLLQVSSAVLAYGHDGPTANDTGGMNVGAGHQSKYEDGEDWHNLESYSSLSSHSRLMAAHVVLMVLAWFFVLPIGVVFSISRSRYTLPVQSIFIILNGLGVFFGTIYNVSTPDLYENNAHHTLGWVATWVVTVQVVLSLLFLCSGRRKEPEAESNEDKTFPPVSSANMAWRNMAPYPEYRWSGDSGQGTERSSRDVSPNEIQRFLKPEAEDDEEDEEGTSASLPPPLKPSRFRIRVIDIFLSARVPSLLSAKLLRTTEIAYEVVDRTILILGFAELLSGGAVYAGIFRGKSIFNGMAHFVKGGIFFWYGLLTLGRWMGCFADLGWAWNIQPSRTEVGQRKASFPSAEFVESLVIFIYGCTDVFMEHMAAWGKPWAAQDLEHVSISIMFFGGGLCGMLVESKRIRKLLNASIEVLPSRADMHQEDAQMIRQQPRTYAFSLNPIPALVIFLLGIMMSSHHQDSMVSTMVHKQWGTLFIGFSFARVATYTITYISPPTSIYPNRPPCELIAAFCLIAGGLIFMGSTKDITRIMDERNLMAMFIFTVVMGLTAFIMAWEVVVLALKGWAVRREIRSPPKH